MKLFLEGDDDSGTALVFVYGTLRRGFNHPMARLLAFHAHHVGAGRLNGRLYHLGRYPGAIISHRPDEWVRGDLYLMKSPSVLLARMDNYEGIEAGRRSFRAEYQRVMTAVARDDGTTVRAWVYLYCRPVSRLKRLSNGDFLRQKRRLPVGSG